MCFGVGIFVRCKVGCYLLCKKVFGKSKVFGLDCKLVGSVVLIFMFIEL